MGDTDTGTGEEVGCGAIESDGVDVDEATTLAGYRGRRRGKCAACFGVLGEEHTRVEFVRKEAGGVGRTGGTIEIVRDRLVACTIPLCPECFDRALAGAVLTGIREAP